MRHFDAIFRLSSIATGAIGNYERHLIFRESILFLLQRLLISAHESEKNRAEERMKGYSTRKWRWSRVCLFLDLDWRSEKRELNLCQVFLGQVMRDTKTRNFLMGV